jgi:hypothetical protein
VTRNNDFNEVIEQVQSVLSLSQATMDEIRPNIPATLTTASIDIKTNSANDVPLSQVLKRLRLFGDVDVNGPAGQIPLGLYLLLYIRLHQDSELRHCRTYADFKLLFAGYAGAGVVPCVFRQLCFYSLAYLIEKENIAGEDLFSTCDVADWQDAEQLASVLPLVKMQISSLMRWLSSLAKQYPNDAGLETVAKSVYAWTIGNPANAAEIEKDLTVIARDNHAVVFISPFLSAAREITEKPVSYYMDLVGPVMVPKNTYNILYALAIISSDSESDRNVVYECMLDKLKKEWLSLGSFVQLCTLFKFFRSALFEEIERALPLSDDPPLIRTIILLLKDTNQAIDPHWKNKISGLIVGKNSPELITLVSNLVMMTAVDNAKAAQALLEYRMSAGVSLTGLEDAIRYLVSRGVPLFQQQLVSWWITEDEVLHAGLRSLCSVLHTQVGLFTIPAAMLSSLSNRDKVYMAYKVAGYAYSMEPLQGLIISIVQSIDGDHAGLRAILYTILSEYVIYNYRTTLDILRKHVEHPGIGTAFSISLFEELIRQYEAYFLAIRAIDCEKELTPYRQDVMLMTFYRKKHYKLDPRQIRRQSIVRHFKNTQLNSDHWAVRRPDQPGHQVSPLQTFSVQSEFPAGEKLSPIFQEHLRRTYQKLKKDEINID